MKKKMKCEDGILRAMNGNASDTLSPPSVKARGLALGNG